MIDAEETVSGYEVKPTTASISGVTLRVGHRSGGFLSGRGGLVSVYSTRNKEADHGLSRRSLGSGFAKQATECVVCDDSGSFMLNKATGQIGVLREECSNCMLELWVPPIKKLGFGPP